MALKKKKMLSKKQRQKKVVEMHVSSLFAQLRHHMWDDFLLAERYAWLIRKISMKHNYALPRDIKRSYCKHCKTLFVPGRNCRVRVRRGLVVYRCDSCKRFTRIPYK